MSAAATAAGYLYASGRLRGKNGDKTAERSQKDEPRRREIRVAVLPLDNETETRQDAAPTPPRRVPKIEYRKRRWTPGSEDTGQ